MEKESFKYPSRYEIGETVQLNLGYGQIIKPVSIGGINFTESKIRYDLAFEYDKGIYGHLDNVDSIFVEDLGQKEPNQFAKLSDIKELIDTGLGEQTVIDKLNKLYEGQ